MTNFLDFLPYVIAAQVIIAFFAINAFSNEDLEEEDEFYG